MVLRKKGEHMATIYSSNGIEISHYISERPDGKDYKMHVHDTYEILCPVEGDVSYLVEGSKYTMPEGCVMLMRPAETHMLVLGSQALYDRYVINFRADVLEELGFGDTMMSAFVKRDLGEGNRYLATDFFGVTPIELFRQTEEACRVCDSPREAVLANLAAILCAVNTAYLTQTERARAENTDEIGKTLISYVNEHLTEELTLERVSSSVHMSPSQASRIFKRLTGASIYDYVLSKRLVMARALIEQGEGAVTASRKCGFEDYSSFYRLYKKRMGTVPSALRNKEN